MGSTRLNIQLLPGVKWFLFLCKARDCLAFFELAHTIAVHLSEQVPTTWRSGTALLDGGLLKLLAALLRGDTADFSIVILS